MPMENYNAVAMAFTRGESCYRKSSEDEDTYPEECLGS